MGTLTARKSMLIFNGFLIILALASQVLSISVLCGRDTRKQIMVRAGTYSLIRTKRETIQCTVDYKLALTCSEMKLSCQHFHLPNDNMPKCNRGDFLRVKVGDKPGASKVTRFCRNISPTVTSSKSLRVQYNGVKRKEQVGEIKWMKRGMICTVACSSSSMNS